MRCEGEVVICDTVTVLQFITEQRDRDLQREPWSCSRYQAYKEGTVHLVAGLHSQVLAANSGSYNAMTCSGSSVITIHV